MKRYKEALAAFDKAIELNPKAGWIYMQKGVTLRILEHYEEALANFDHAIELEPDSDWFLYNRAITYQTQGRTAKARSDLFLVIQHAQEKHREEPHDWQKTFNLAFYHLAAGEVQGATRLYQEMLSSNAPPDRIRGAIRDLDDFLALFPDHSQAHIIRNLLQEQ